jgi:hypothetical protein
MLLYDVTYPNSKAFDRDCTWSYLARVAHDPKLVGAIATCKNGEHFELKLAEDGKWYRLESAK